MAHAMFKKAVKWLGLILLAHLAAMLLFAIVMAGSTESVAKESPSDAYRMVLVFDIIFYLAFILLANRFETSYAEYHRILKNAVKEEDFSMIGYYKSFFFKEQLIKAGVLSVFHIPFAIFYRMFGFSMTATTGFEKFYILDAGFYGVSGSAILGFLICTLVLAMIYVGLGFGVFAINCIRAKKEIISFGH